MILPLPFWKLLLTSRKINLFIVYRVTRYFSSVCPYVWTISLWLPTMTGVSKMWPGSPWNPQDLFRGPRNTTILTQSSSPLSKLVHLPLCPNYPCPKWLKTELWQVASLPLYTNQVLICTNSLDWVSHLSMPPPIALLQDIITFQDYISSNCALYPPFHLFPIHSPYCTHSISHHHSSSLVSQTVQILTLCNNLFLVFCWR